MSSKKQKPTKLGNYKTFRTCKHKYYGYGSIEVVFFIKEMENYIAKKNIIQKRQRDWRETNPSQANP